ncbi:hypothetical protein CSPX01_03233 [Colletotrichum filicis]|nr:hypothetical protein CSPX01_03233 [Colletotrichum filicis]
MPTTPTLSVVVHSELSRLQLQADKRRSSFHPRASRSAVSVATTADSPAIGAARGAWEVGASPADWPEEFSRIPRAKVNVMLRRRAGGINRVTTGRPTLVSTSNSSTLTRTSASFREILAFSPMGDDQAVGFGLGLTRGDGSFLLLRSLTSLFWPLPCGHFQLALMTPRLWAGILLFACEKSWIELEH